MSSTGHPCPHGALTSEAAELNLSSGSFYVHLTNLLLAHPPQATNQEVKKERTQLTGLIF